MQALGIPFTALASVIFGLMIIAFPMGAYVVFNSNLENSVSYDFPLTDLDFFLAGIGFEIPIEFELGDVFIGFWCIFLIIFVIAVLGPKSSFLKALSPIMSEGKYETKSNYLLFVIKWFAILIVISLVIDFIQNYFGVTTEPPESSDALIQFFKISAAPISEEIGFRVMLIGIPLFLMYSYRFISKTIFQIIMESYSNTSY